MTSFLQRDACLGLGACAPVDLRQSSSAEANSADHARVSIICVGHDNFFCLCVEVSRLLFEHKQPHVYMQVPLSIKAATISSSKAQRILDTLPRGTIRSLNKLWVIIRFILYADGSEELQELKYSRKLM